MIGHRVLCRFWSKERLFPPGCHLLRNAAQNCYQLCNCAVMLFTTGWYSVCMCLLAFSEPGCSSHSSYNLLTKGFEKGSATRTCINSKKKNQSTNRRFTMPHDASKGKLNKQAYKIKHIKSNEHRMGSSQLHLS